MINTEAERWWQNPNPTCEYPEPAGLNLQEMLFVGTNNPTTTSLHTTVTNWFLWHLTSQSLCSSGTTDQERQVQQATTWPACTVTADGVLKLHKALPFSCSWRIRAFLLLLMITKTWHTKTLKWEKHGSTHLTFYTSANYSQLIRLFYKSSAAFKGNVPAWHTYTNTNMPVPTNTDYIPALNRNTSPSPT